MKKIILLGAALGLIVAAVPEASAKTFKSGIWKYKTSKGWVKGRCPAPKMGKGKIKLVRKGKRFTVKVLSGLKCSPKSMCHFKGRQKGKLWIASNMATVDKEGGKAGTTLTFHVRSSKKLTGTSRSLYKHPSGFTCRWGFNFVVTR